MCGFLITNLDLDSKVFSNALVTLSHRGPDHSSGPVIHGGFTVGHYRLIIIGDLISGKQPMLDEEEGLSILFNGEIYNYKELARDHRIQLRANSDTELILKLYRLLGDSFVKHLNGMFAFVIIDKKLNRLFIARDRLGAKPLFEWRCGEDFVLASEVRAITELVDDSEPDEFSIRQYRCVRSLLGGRSFYKNIRAFPSGCWSDGKTKFRYWQLEQTFSTPPQIDELEDLVRSAIDYRMVADVEVAGFLSGGLDSTVTTLVSGVKRTWSVGFDEDEDLRHAAKVAGLNNLQHTQVIVDRETFLSSAVEMILARGEPLCVPNEVLIFRMASDARRNGIKCTLSGEGADELFAGYDRIFQWAWNTKSFDLNNFASLYCYGQVDLEVLEEAITPYLGYETPYLIINAFFQVEHLGALLKRLDYASMLASIEAREPFADYRLVERLFGLPFTWKCGELGPKTPLKQAFSHLVPKEVCMRQKLGFPVPLESIFSDDRGVKSGYASWFDFNLKTLGWLQ